MQVECRQDVPPQRSYPTVDVADGRVITQVQKSGQDWVADLGELRHRAGLDVVHTVAHHQLGSVVQRMNEPRDLPEVIREIGVDHHHVVAARGVEASEVGLAVAAAGLLDHPRLGGARDVAATVLATRCRRQQLRRQYRLTV
jgi:hypothetical protein